MSLTPRPPLQETIPEFMREKLLWWQLKIPQSLLDQRNLTSKSKNTRSKHFESEHLFHWLQKTENSKALTLSANWLDWFESLPEHFFSVLLESEQRLLTQKITALIKQPLQLSSLKFHLRTREGVQTFMAQLHCKVTSGEVTIWAQVISVQNSACQLYEQVATHQNDIESLYKQQQLLEQQNELTKNALQKQSRFLAMLSHELRSPLLGLQAMAKRLAQKYWATAELKDSFHSMSSTVQYLSYLINDILTYAQTEFTSIELYPQEFFLEPLLFDVQTLTNEIAQQKAIQVQVKYRGQDRPVYGDRIRLKQVLLNLVVNSIKFTQNGEVSIWVDALDASRYRFCVMDTGQGMSSDQLERIFEPFLQLKTQQLPHQFGAGLGLFIVKQLVERMGGKIEVFSDLGKGSTFEFELNLSREAQHFHSESNSAAHDPEQDRLLPTNFSTPFTSRPQYSDFLSKTKTEESLDKTFVTELDDLAGQAIFAERLGSLGQAGQTESSDIYSEFEERFLKKKSVEFAKGYRPVKVLIAEDSDLNRWVLKDLLSEFGCEITEAEDGYLAVEQCQQQHFDLLLLDIQMPRKSGIEVAKWVREVSETAKSMQTCTVRQPIIVAVTAGGGLDIFDTPEKQLQQLFDAWLLKPIDYKTVYKILEQYRFLEGTYDQDNLLPTVDVEQIQEQEKKKGAVHFDSFEQIPPHFLTLFSEFLVQTEVLLKELEQSAFDKHWQSVATAAHKLKGNMIMFQLTQAATWLSQLEQSDKSVEKEELKQFKVQQVCQNLRTLVKDLEKSYSMIDN